MVDIIDDVTDEIKDTLYDLMKNKISLSDFFENVDSAIDNIESCLEESQFPQAVKDYVDATMIELEKIREKILTYAGEGGKIRNMD